MKTVGDLRKLLEILPDDMPVVLSSDAEGNGYSPLSITERALYVQENTWSGEVFDPGDAPDNAVIALVLYPVN